METIALQKIPTNFLSVCKVRSAQLIQVTGMTTSFLLESDQSQHLIHLITWDIRCKSIITHNFQPHAGDKSQVHNAHKLCGVLLDSCHGSLTKCPREWGDMSVVSCPDSFQQITSLPLHHKIWVPFFLKLASYGQQLCTVWLRGSANVALCKLAIKVTLWCVDLLLSKMPNNQLANWQ